VEVTMVGENWWQRGAREWGGREVSVKPHLPTKLAIVKVAAVVVKRRSALLLLLVLMLPLLLLLMPLLLLLLLGGGCMVGQTASSFFLCVWGLEWFDRWISIRLTYMDARAPTQRCPQTHTCSRLLSFTTLSCSEAERGGEKRNGTRDIRAAKCIGSPRGGSQCTI